MLQGIRGDRRPCFHVILSTVSPASLLHCFNTAVCFVSAVTHSPFHASVLRPASQVGPMHEATGMGKLVNAALLSLINEACVSVCCAIPPLDNTAVITIRIVW